MTTLVSQRNYSKDKWIAESVVLVWELSSANACKMGILSKGDKLKTCRIV